MSYWNWQEHALVRILVVKQKESHGDGWREFVIDKDGNFHNSAYAFVESVCDGNDELWKEYIEDVPNELSQDWIRLPATALLVETAVHDPSQLSSEFEDDSIKKAIFEELQKHFIWKQGENKILSIPDSWVMTFDCWTDRNEYEGDYDSGADLSEVLWKSDKCVHINEHGAWHDK